MRCMYMYITTQVCNILQDIYDYIVLPRLRQSHSKFGTCASCNHMNRTFPIFLGHRRHFPEPEVA